MGVSVVKVSFSKKKSSLVQSPEKTMALVLSLKQVSIMFTSNKNYTL